MEFLCAIFLIFNNIKFFIFYSAWRLRVSSGLLQQPWVLCFLYELGSSFKIEEGVDISSSTVVWTLIRKELMLSSKILNVVPCSRNCCAPWQFAKISILMLHVPLVPL